MTHRDTVRKFYDAIATEYDAHMEETAHYSAQKNLYSALKEYFISPVLDLAAGPGYLSEHLLNEGYEVMLNDFSPEMFKSFSEKYKKYKRASFLNHDAHELKIDRKFDTILCSNLFYYLDDRDKAIKNWKSLLNEGGKVILFEEFPFIITKNGDTFSEQEKILKSIIDLISTERIQEYFSNNGMALVKKSIVPIDQKHDLYGYVFTETN